MCEQILGPLSRYAFLIRCIPVLQCFHHLSLKCSVLTAVRNRQQYLSVINKSNQSGEFSQLASPSLEARNDSKEEQLGTFKEVNDEQGQEFCLTVLRDQKKLWALLVCYD